jgi:hypothetical protein
LSRRKERDWPCKELRERTQRDFAAFHLKAVPTAGHSVVRLRM